MLLDEKINDLQNLTQQKISYQQVADVLGLGSKQAAYNRVTRKQPLKEWEIIALDNAFLTDVNKTNQKQDCITVDYYPEVYGSCGGGTLVVSEQKELIQVPKKFFTTFSPVKKYSVVKAKGESMRPTLQPDDKLIIEHWNGEQIIDNEIYIFCYKDEIFVKRLIKNIDEIIILSDNDEAVYRPRFIEKEEINNILIIGRIVGLMREF